MKALRAVLASVALLLIVIPLLLRHVVTRTFSVEEVASLARVSGSMSAAEILEEFRSAGIKDAALAKMLDASPWTLDRIRKGSSLPVARFESTLGGLYSGFLLMDGRKTLFLLLVRTHPGMTDQFYAYKDPGRELVW